MKKRGVLISTAHHPRPIAKSSSAHTNPFPRPPPPNPLTQSNLLSEEPQRLVNHAYYTYQDPDSLPHNESHRSEENDEEVIESMQKKQEQLIRQRKEDIIKETNKPKPITNRIQNKNKQVTLNKIKTATTNQVRHTPRTKIKENTQNKQKMESKGDIDAKKQRRELNPAILKPRPLVFSVNMFAKGNLSPRSRAMQDDAYLKLSQRIEERASRGYPQDPPYEQPQGQNLNCKKLPFRFSSLI